MKKPAIPKPTTGYKPSPLLPSKDVLSFDEIFQWIKKEEGKPSLNAVKDGKDKKGNQLYSIGFGHQLRTGEEGYLTRAITEQEALTFLEQDISNIRIDMNKNIKVPLNKNQQLALLSLRYNIGGSAFNDSSLLRKVNEGDFSGAALLFKDWRLSEGKINLGLVNRRERERQLFSKPV